MWKLPTALLSMGCALISAATVSRAANDDGGFMNHCDILGTAPWFVDESSNGRYSDMFVHGHCKDDGQTYHTSKLDLGLCYNLVDHNIQPVGDGSGTLASAGPTCEMYASGQGEAWMVCLINDDTRGDYIASARLNGHIQARNGVLGCGSLEGTLI